MFFSVNSTSRFAILSCFNPAETFHFSVRLFVYIRSPPPPNNLINARAPNLDPRLSLFFEVRYCQSGFSVQASVCLGPVSRKSREAVSVYETKWSRLLARTRALILYISIWIFVFGPEKLPGLLRNEPLASKLYMLKKDLTRFIHLFPSTQNSRRWKKCSASWVGKER